MNIDQAKLLSLLNEVLDQHASIRKDVEAVYHCPLCNHHKNKLEINLETQRYHCWVCNISGLSIRSLFKKLNLNTQYFNRLYDITKDYKINFSKKDDKTHEIKKLPKEFIPLWKQKTSKFISPHRRHALKYLKKRNISDLEMMRYNIGYAEDGEFEGRIIIPSYDSHGNLNFFTGRSFYDSIQISYKNPDWSKDIIGFEIFINWRDDITIVEGVYDAFAVKHNVIPLFGKTMNFSLKEALIRNGVGRVNIALDKDAKKEIMNIQNFLFKHEIDSNIIKLDEKDPSVLGYEKMNSLIHESKTSDFTDVVKMKLFE